MSIQLKSKAEIDKMRQANLLVCSVLDKLESMVRPGVTTAELDAVARDMTVAAGATPAFLGYPSSAKNVQPFPGVICSSVNEVIVHGIPNDIPLQEGDIISVDYGCCLDGFFGDAARTIPVGRVAEEAALLLKVTREALEAAIGVCVAGNRIGDISHAVQSRVERDGFGVVREFVGHGIGRAMHEPPHVPNFGAAGQGRILKPGMVLAIEPMVTQGSYEARVLDDGWTAVTKDGKLAAHFEHSVAITDGEPFVLSRRDA
ncbi:MAG: type I methionyl aminopeptidase [Bdellovibrionales bacterium]|nr:type I methionyl aminopeptidase [Bdellovibrionales bacterium]